MTDHLKRSEELLAFDLQYQTGGLTIAGMDEVGRGPLAGNVVTACVVMPEEPVIPWIDDSKRLSEIRRDIVFEEIMSKALYVGIGEVSPEEIDRINILEATRKAMRTAASAVPADLFLIDAVTKLGLKIPTNAENYEDFKTQIQQSEAAFQSALRTNAAW